MSEFEAFEPPCQEQVEQVKKDIEAKKQAEKMKKVKAVHADSVPEAKPARANAEITQSAVGLSVAALVLGLVSLPFIIVPMFISTVMGLVGIILAIIHLAKKLTFRGLAIWGLCLSVLGFGGGTFVSGLSWYRMHTMFADYEGGGMDINPAIDEFLGKQAPAVTLTDLDGNQIDLQSLKGKRVVLNFWATWCGPCKMEIPDIVKIRNENSADKLVIIGISDDDPEMIKNLAGSLGINYSLVSMDFDSLPEPFKHVNVYPTTIIIDAQGNVEDYFMGALEYDDLKEYFLGDGLLKEDIGLQAQEVIQSQMANEGKDEL